MLRQNVIYLGLGVLQVQHVYLAWVLSKSDDLEHVKRFIVGELSPTEAEEAYCVLGPHVGPVALTDIIIIDEVYMCSAFLWTLMDIVLRGRAEDFLVPFGGISVLGAGDPLQGGCVPLESYALNGKCLCRES